MENPGNLGKLLLKIVTYIKTGVEFTLKFVLVQFLTILGYVYRNSILKLLKIHGNNPNYIPVNDAFAMFVTRKDQPDCFITFVLKLRGKSPYIEKIKRSFLNALDYETSVQLPPSNATYRPFEKLRCRLETKFLVDFWVKCEDFRIDDHVFEEILSPGVSIDEKVLEYVNGNSTMCPQRPKWKVTMFRPAFSNSSNIADYALIISIDHAYGDGYSFFQFLRFGLCDEPFNFPVDPMTSRTERASVLWKNTSLRSIFSYALQDLRDAFHKERYSFTTKRENPVQKTLFSFGNSISLAKIKKLRMLYPEIRTSGFFFASLVKALRRIYREAGISLPDLLPASMVYAVLPYESVTTVNNFILAYTPLLLTEIDDLSVMRNSSKLIASFAQDHARMAVTKTMQEFYHNILKPFFPATEMLYEPGFTVSNVVGPENKISMFNGDEVVQIRGFVSSTPRKLPAFLALTSYNDELLPTSCTPTETEKLVPGMKNLGTYFSEAASDILEAGFKDESFDHCDQNTGQCASTAIPRNIARRS